MRGLLALVLSGCLTLSQAYQVPADAADGIYLVQANTNGNELVTYEPIPTASVQPISAKLRARQLPDDGVSYCHTRDSSPYNVDDLAVAKGALSYWCAAGGRAAYHSRVLVKYQGSLAYMCAHGATSADQIHGFTCTPGEVDASFYAVEQKCPGNDHGGMYYVLQSI